MLRGFCRHDRSHDAYYLKYQKERFIERDNSPFLYRKTFLCRWGHTAEYGASATQDKHMNFIKERWRERENSLLRSDTFSQAITGGTEQPCIWPRLVFKKKRISESMFSSP